MLKFSNKEVDEKFESLVAEDRMVHKIGVYSGLLSNVNPEMAEILVSGNHNLLQPKPTESSNTDKSVNLDQ
jgi:hypothetical protein